MKCHGHLRSQQSGDGDPLQVSRYFIAGIISILLTDIITMGVSHRGLAIYIKKYLKAKEELQKLKYFTMQTYNLQKILENKPKSFKTLQLYN
jgi:hypothetical protein